MKKGSNYTANPSDTFRCGHPRDRTNMRFSGGDVSCLQCGRASEERYRQKRLLAHAQRHLHPNEQAA